MQEAKLYLIFEFLTMDLKKYMDTNIPKDGQMDPKLTKSYLYQVMNFESSIKSSNIIFQFLVASRHFVLSSAKSSAQRHEATESSHRQEWMHQNCRFWPRKEDMSYGSFGTLYLKINLIKQGDGTINVDTYERPKFTGLSEQNSWKR